MLFDSAVIVRFFCEGYFIFLEFTKYEPRIFTKWFLHIKKEVCKKCNCNTAVKSDTLIETRTFLFNEQTLFLNDKVHYFL